MTAITWKNVDAPQISDFYKPLVAAGQMMNDSFSGLQDILKQREATINTNHIQGQNSDYAAQIAKLRTYATPEALAEAQKANVFDQANAAGMGNANYVKFADQLRAAPAALMQQRIEKDAYAEHALGQQQKPLVEAYHTALFKKDYKAAGSLLDANSVVNEAALRDKLTSSVRQNEQDLRAVAGEKRAIGADNRSAATHAASMHDRNQLNSLNTLVSESANQYIKDTSAWEKNFKKVAHEHGAEINAIGNVGTGVLSKEALNAIYARVGPPPSQDSYMAQLANETAKRNLAGHANTVTSAFSSVVNAATPPGATSPANKAAEEKIRVAYDSKKKRNPFVTEGAAEDEEILGKINKQITTGMKDEYFFGTSHPAEKILKLATEGIKITNSAGKTENFKVPPRLLQLAVDKADIEKDTNVMNNSVGHVENMVTSMLKQPEYQEYLAESDLFKNGNKFTSELNNHRNNNVPNNASERWAKLIAHMDSAAAAAARDGAVNLKKP